VFTQLPRDILYPLILQSILLEDRVQLAQSVSDLVHALGLGYRQLWLGIHRRPGDRTGFEEEGDLIVGREEVVVADVFALFRGGEGGLSRRESREHTERPNDHNSCRETRHRMVGKVHLLNQLLGLFQHLLRVIPREEIGDDIVSDEATAGSVRLLEPREVLAHPSFRNLATASSSSMGILNGGLGELQNKWEVYGKSGVPVFVDMIRCRDIISPAR
jgi:hypothetical protein